MGYYNIRKEIVEKSPGPKTFVGRKFSYINKSQKLMDVRSITSESDYYSEMYRRVSDDNGVTWSDWEDIHASSYITKGNDEIMVEAGGVEAYNPTHDHYVSISMQRIFEDGHKHAFERFWGKGEKAFFDHCFLYVSKEPGGHDHRQLVQYEEGAVYDEDNHDNPDYLWNNDAYCGVNLQVLHSGDILFAIAPNILSCCKILKLNANDIFPSCPNIMWGLMIVRGIWNEEKQMYDLVFSKPLVISDLKSSFGVCEPIVYQLESGRILTVFRGSNENMKNWNSRIEKGTPGHKWYTYSDDGGLTFTDPVPWHYDNGEVFYSSATYSDFFKSTKNNKLYWIGNITSPEVTGDSPRYPLVIAQVDQKQGLLIKNTLAIIDDRDLLVDAKTLQLSNFGLLENRETNNLEIYLSRLGANQDDLWMSDAYRYTIEFL